MLIDTSLEKLNISGAGSTRYHFCYNKKRKENIIIKFLTLGVYCFTSVQDIFRRIFLSNLMAEI